MAEEKKRKELMEEWGLSVDQINEVFEAAERVSKEVSDEDIDKVLKDYIEHQDNFDFVSNLHPPSYPDGNDVEVVSMSALKDAWQNAVRVLEREHTTPYLWENPDKFKIGNVLWESGKNYSKSHRFTIDYPEDYHFIKKVYDELFDENRIFTLEDILELLERKPEIKNINSKYAGINWYRNHLDELKTISGSDTNIISDN